jgi:hypothetical protein
MNWTVLVAYCIIDDLLKTLGHKDDPQSKTPASVVLTLWILAALAFAGKHKHALISTHGNRPSLACPFLQPLQPTAAQLVLSENQPLYG